MKKTILITGANGMLGKDASKLFCGSGYEVISATRLDFDITDYFDVSEFFAKNNFDLVLHAAAYTKVDDAQKDRDIAFLVNAKGARNIAIATNKKNVPIVYISTDYVFDGNKNSPYFPSDATNPLNIYGASKLAGEVEVRKENPKHYIVRTSWLYGKYGKNFVDTMIQMAKTQNTIKVVDDQYGCPTWTNDLILGIKQLIENKNDFGTYQICGSGVASWYEFAKEIFTILNLDIELIPVSTHDFPRPAVRPKFSAMDNSGLARDWRVALKEYLNQKS